MRTAPLAGVSATAALLLLVLTACGPSADPVPTETSTSSSGPSAPAEPSSTPTPTSRAADLPEGVLFRVSATATAPNGAVAHLVETVHAPVPTVDATVEAQLDQECAPSWRNSFPTVAFVAGDVETTVVSGDWGDDLDRIAADVAGYPVWTGDTEPYMAYCASALVGVPGAAHAISPVNAGGADTDGGWAVFRYGFGVAGDPDLSSPGPDDVVMSDCAIEMSDEALDSALANGWADDPKLFGGLACYFGGL